jgi:hypothetical protein
MTLYFQGDVCIERVDDAPVTGAVLPPAADGAVVLAHGEVTGHRHAFYGGAVTLFRDDGLARDMPAELYIGHLVVSDPVARLQHEEHSTIALPKGTYRVRRQREFEEREESRLVED